VLLLPYIFIRVLCDAADNLKVCGATETPTGCSFLLPDIDCVCDLYSTNFIKLNASKIKVISLTKERSVLYYLHSLGTVLIL
jgi:hypothetical protein